MPLKLLLLWLFCCLCAAEYSAVCSAAEWYVSPLTQQIANGALQSRGSGTLEHPWDLQTALNHPSSVKPGDTIWLHGGEYIAPPGAGTYVGTFFSKLVGTAQSPIIVRNYAGQRATIHSTFPPNVIANSYGILITGKYTWFWGLEIATHPDTSQLVLENLTGTNKPNFGAGGVDCQNTTGIKFINCVVHDTLTVGITAQSTNSGTELHGNLLYYNGRRNSYASGQEGGGQAYKGGYATYLANGDSSAPLRANDNICFHQWGWPGLHFFTKGGGMDSCEADGNVVIDNALDIGQITVKEAKFTNNHVYRAYRDRNLGRKSTAAGFYFPWGPAGTRDGVLRNNIVIDAAAYIGSPNTGLIMEGNIFNGYLAEYSSSGTLVSYVNYRTRFPNNTYASYTPGANPWPEDVNLNQVFVRPNKYEPGRAHIIVWNYDEKPTVQADVSRLLGPGDKYVVRDALNFYGPLVASGTYTRAPIELPMTLREVAQPYTIPEKSWQGPPTHTLPKLGVFVLMSSSEQLPPPATLRITEPAPDVQFKVGDTVVAKGEGENLSWRIGFDGAANPPDQIGKIATFTIPLNTNKLILTLAGNGKTVSQSHLVTSVLPPPSDEYELLQFYRRKLDGKIYYKDAGEYKLLELR